MKPQVEANSLKEFNEKTFADEADFQDKLLSAMRFQFGGHLEKPAKS